MKKILVFIITFIMVLTLKSQTYNVNTFNNDTFQKVLFKEMNKYRKDIKIDTLTYSPILYKNISIKNIDEVYPLSFVYHPDVDMDKLKNLFIPKKENKTWGYGFYGEIMLVIDIKKFTNYKDLAINCIKDWENSEGHRLVMTNDYEINGRAGYGSCASRLRQNNKLLVNFNFYKLDYSK